MRDIEFPGNTHSTVNLYGFLSDSPSARSELEFQRADRSHRFCASSFSKHRGPVEQRSTLLTRHEHVYHPMLKRLEAADRYTELDSALGIIDRLLMQRTLNADSFRTNGQSSLIQGCAERLIAVSDLAENMVSGTSTRPGDVLTIYGGKTVEVLNTDAEGRLVLADALVKATEDKPDVIVDVATLTGACQVALGDRVAGVLGNDDELVSSVKAAGERVGEAHWPLPIPEEMGEKVRSNTKIADLAQHNTERWGGALYAAAFLREFVGEHKWAHLDIAGPAFNEKGAYGYVTPGGTGMSVATLVELADTLSRG